jgi:hypothetical protein
MKHWWWRSKEVIGDSVVIDSGQFYPTIWFEFHTKNAGWLPSLLYSNQLLETVYIVLIWFHILTKCSSGMYVYTSFHLVPHFDEMFIRHVYTSFHLVIHFEKCSVDHMHTLDFIWSHILRDVHQACRHQFFIWYHILRNVHKVLLLLWELYF